MKKNIGELYEKEKFNRAFDAAAKSLVSNVMGEFADTERGNQARAEAVARLRARIKTLPTSFYRLLEAYIDGEDITEYLIDGSKEQCEQLMSRGESGLIDLMSLISEGALRLKNAAEAERYYEKKTAAFRSSGKKGADGSSEISDIQSWREESKKRLRTFDAEKKRIQRFHLKNHQEIRREHAAFIDEKGDIGKHDSANKLLRSLYGEFKREHKTLVKMENLVMSIKRRLIPLEVMKEYGVISDVRLSRHDRLRERMDSAARDLECYMNALDELNEVRYKNGIISEALYLKRCGNMTDSIEAEPQRRGESESASGGTRIALSLDEVGEISASETSEKKAPEREKSEPEL